MNIFSYEYLACENFRWSVVVCRVAISDLVFFAMVFVPSWSLWVDAAPRCPPSPVAEAEGTERRTRSTPTRERLRDNREARGLSRSKGSREGSAPTFLQAPLTVKSPGLPSTTAAPTYTPPLDSLQIHMPPPEQIANRARMAPHHFASVNATGALPIVQLTKGNPLSQAS